MLKLCGRAFVVLHAEGGGRGAAVIEVFAAVRASGTRPPS